MGILKKALGKALGWQPPPMTPAVTGKEWLSWSSERKQALVREYFNTSFRELFDIGVDANNVVAFLATFDKSLNYTAKLFSDFSELFDARAKEHPDDPHLNMWMFTYLHEWQKVALKQFEEQRYTTQDIVSRYGAVLEEPYGMLRPESSLPAPKDAIKAALIEQALQLRGGGEVEHGQIEALRIGYMVLADFVADDIARRHRDWMTALSRLAAALANSDLSSDEKARQRRAARADDEVKAALATSTDEGTRLLQEFDYYLFQAAYDLVSECGEVVVEHAGGLFKPIDLLPASKDAIRAAMLKVANAERRAGRLSDDKRDSLRMRYGALACFVPADAAEPINGYLRTKPADVGYAEEFPGLDPRYWPVFQGSRSEAKALVAEFDQAVPREDDSSTR